MPKRHCALRCNFWNCLSRLVSLRHYEHERFCSLCTMVFQSLKMKNACADQFEGSAINHFASDVENNCKPDVGNPAVLLKQTRYQIGRETHQRNRQQKTRKQGRMDALVWRRLAPAH